MTTIVQIGDKDNKLTQQEWASYVEETHTLVVKYSDNIYFFGVSSTYAYWQNVCIVFELTSGTSNSFKYDLVTIRMKYRQNSVACIEGETSFI
jgi:hypothetical protein